MISPILGHDIKRSRSEALQSELDEFLARGGKINGGAIAVKYEFNNRKVPVINHNTEYLEDQNSAERCKCQLFRIMQSGAVRASG